MVSLRTTLVTLALALLVSAASKDDNKSGEDSKKSKVDPKKGKGGEGGDPKEPPFKACGTLDFSGTASYIGYDEGGLRDTGEEIPYWVLKPVNGGYQLITIKGGLAYQWNDYNFVLAPPNAEQQGQIFDIKCDKCYHDSAEQTPLRMIYANDCVFTVGDKCVTATRSKDPESPENAVIKLKKCTNDRKNQVSVIWHQPNNGKL
ncbi:hypothetical protein Moror_14892 [Moniliophthora roreri MCA 2997]|uniref:Uncharacterized protein n=1 Tax=Moniliophthora roreri (strain MCA 2997) TaxID=1381753 RepID=V2WKV9_MONRO|nr:hypothetical protein Moror_14892 [Moniliophthora roreri MCA 2997]